MGTLFRNDLNKYKQYFKESAKLLGIDVDYRYILQRNTENQSGESIYSKFSQPITQSVVIEQGIPRIDSLKQLGWFVDTEQENLLVDFPIDTPNLQEGCRFTISSNENFGQNKEYVVIKMSTNVLYTTCIKCLCEPVLENESKYNEDGSIDYGQQEITSDEENYTFINEQPELKFF